MTNKKVAYHKKMKNTIKLSSLLIVLIIIFITGCQKTPDDLIVQNKADDDLAEAIAVTAEPVATEPEASEEPDINADLLKETYRLTETVTNDLGNITLEIDADVIPLNIPKIPVAIVEPYDMTEDDASAVATAFFGNAKYSDPKIRTKSEIEAAIVQAKKSATDLSSDMATASGTTTMVELQEVADEQIARLEELWKDAPDEKPETSDFDVSSHSSSYYNVNIGKAYKGFLDFSNSSNYSIKYLLCLASKYEMFRTNMRFLTEYATRPVEDTDDPAYQKAKQRALELIDAAGLGETVKLGDTYISKDCLGDTRYVSNEEYYVFTFERIVGDGTIDYSFHMGSRTYEDYGKPFEYEKIEVWAYKDTGELVEFLWRSPTIVTEIINDNVKIEIDDEQAIDAIKKQAFIQYADFNGDWKIVIDKIELALTRVKERDSDRYLVVPAWQCYGELAEKRSEGGYRYQLGKEQEYKNIITINALDGTVIDMERTY